MSDKGNFNVKELKKLRQISFRDTKIEVNPEDEIKAEEQEISFEERERQAELERYEADSIHRKKLILWATTLVSIWLGAVIIILLSVGFNIIKLSDTVMATLLGTTTLNVLGLMAIVLKDLFKGRDK
ncbi:hypothetical protein DVK85_06735 [Flavobacterium arcticum]|uniref:Uncharacterized protein n=1 Tax=Flavobacterium arcticum TaxID=1784713 RepID=A0A345HBJ6_9FLAO|nr:hypothetical protein [Flavobacterium arcticum]AXG73956.1 hypothetical protein DVK85_06735 [Flavobacterium arcticum]KAF2508932.1 hypothetical protein E0W72_10220 [Flavobacterium arcticum]